MRYAIVIEKAESNYSAYVRISRLRCRRHFSRRSGDGDPQGHQVTTWNIAKTGYLFRPLRARLTT